MRDRVQRRALVQSLGAGEIEEPFIDARCLHDGRPQLENGANGPMHPRARAPRHGNAHRVGAEAQRASDRHCGAHAELARLVGRRADHAAAAGRSAHDEEGRASGALGILHARHGDEERVGIGQEDAAGGPESVEHGRKIEAGRSRALVAATRWRARRGRGPNRL